MDKGWNRCVLRTKLMKLPRGQVVAVSKTKLVHTSIGQTYWVMSLEHEVIYQVAEATFGRNLNQLLIRERLVKDQDLCRSFANILLTRGQYGTEHRHEIRKLLRRSKSRRA